MLDKKNIENYIHEINQTLNNNFNIINDCNKVCKLTNYQLNNIEIERKKIIYETLQEILDRNNMQNIENKIKQLSKFVS